MKRKEYKWRYIWFLVILILNNYNIVGIYLLGK